MGRLTKIMSWSFFLKAFFWYQKRPFNLYFAPEKS